MFDKKWFRPLSVFTFETTLLVILPLSILFPSELGSIVPWTEISSISILRAGLWLFVLCLFPGLYVLRISRIAENNSSLTRIVLGVNLSFVLVALMTLICYYLGISLSFLPWLFLIFLGVLHPIWWFKTNKAREMSKLEFSKPRLLLIIGVIVATLIAFGVQLSQRYLVPGDVWVSLKPGVEMVFNRNPFELSSVTQYPVVFGIILAGLSVCLGLPVVNSYVLLFPLVGLNLAIFFVFLKNVMEINDKISAIATILYGFGGGLAWLFQIVFFQGADNWNLNFLTQDIYFSMSFWNTQEFSHRTLALTLSFASVISYLLSAKQKNRSIEIVALTLSSLFMVFSFYVHMIEPIVFVPLILIAAWFKKTDRSRYFSLGFFVFMTVIIALSLDFLMSGYYVWLSIVKVTKFLLSGDTTNYSLYLFVACLSLLIAVVSIRDIRSRFGKPKFSVAWKRMFSEKKYKLLFAVCLSGIYFLGLLFFAPYNGWNMSPFPWYMYVTRYGFVGVLALIGFAVADCGRVWFKISAAWGLLVIVLGSLWWGTKMNACLFPVLTIFAGFGAYIIWQKANMSLQITVTSVEAVKRSLHVNIKPAICVFLIVTLVLSFSTFIYGSVQYSISSVSLTDDEAMVLSRINYFAPQNATVIVPDLYNIRTGVETIGDRIVFPYSQLPTISDGASFVNFISTISSQNIHFLIKSTDFSESGPLDFLASYSELLFRYGSLSAYRVPSFSPPTSEGYEVTVYDRESIGFSGDTNTFGWIDDSFVEGWSYSNVAAKSDGEILEFPWMFNSTDKREPAMKFKFTPIQSDEYPFLVVRYRNNEETSNYAQDTVRQIVSLIGEEGYPQGFIDNYYLPISIGEKYQIYAQKLSANTTLAEVWIWMRNYGGQNGSVDLEIDYVGFASSKFIAESPVNLRLLPIALSALWPANYFVTSELNETGNTAVLVSTYSKNILGYFENNTNTEIFIFVNQTASSPSWGVKWRNLEKGIISGYFNEKRVLILGTEFLHYNDITHFAQFVFEELKEYVTIQN